MKQLKLIILLTVLMSMVGARAFAYDAKIDGIYYNFSGTKATVTYEGLDEDGDPYSDYENNIVIPDNVVYNESTYSVTSIGENAFRGCKLISVTIPNSVTTIGRRAFYYCGGLTSLTIPNSVTSIGYSAFEGCTSLVSITIGNGVKSIYAYTFGDCSALKSITFGTGLLSINKYAFRDHWDSPIPQTGRPVKVIWLSETPPEGYNSCIYIGDPINYVPNEQYDFSGYTHVQIVYPFLNLMFKVNGVIYVPTSMSELICDVIDGVYDESAEKINIGTSVSYNDVTYTVKNVSKYAFYSNLFTKEAKLSFEGNIDDCAFYGCSGLTSITIGNGVKSIGSYAFSGCTGLTSIEIPNNVTNIGNSAFYYCSGLNSITIPNSVTSIGDDAFNGTAWYNNQPDGLVYAGKIAYKYKGTMPANTSITIEDGTLGIAGDAFYGCSGLNSVSIPNGVTQIGEKAFYICTGLTSAAIPNSVTTIGDYAFYGCSGLTSVTVEWETPLTIDPYVFSNNTNATLYVPKGSKTAYETANFWKDFKEIVEMSGPSPTIEFADANVKAICVANWDSDGDGELSEVEAAAVTGLEDVFNGKTNIKSFDELKYFTGLTSIGYWAFGDCSGLTSITIPNSVTNIGEMSFSGCSGLKSVIIGNSVTSIGWSAFSDCSSLASITIPNSVTSIGDCVFYGCSHLTSITIPNSVKTIGERVFMGCSRLTSINLPYSVASISREAFAFCSSLTSVTIPNSVTSINYGAFSNSHLTSITIPNSVKTIGERAFEGCTGLTSISIPNSVTDIEYLAFSGCSSLKTVIIGNGVTSIVDGAFNDCSGLTSITIPNSVTSIGGMAFSGCSRLTSITIPNSVTTIGDGAFQDCSGLTSISIPNSVTSIGELAFIRCSSLTSITIPNSVTSIGRLAFCSCSGLISIKVESGNANYDSRNNSNAIIETASNTLIVGCKNTIIPNSVTSIGESAFQDCRGLTSITIPNGVTSFGNQAFSGCSALTAVTTERKTPLTINSSTFPSRTNATLYVPYGSKAVYEATDYWKEFKEIVEMPAPYNSHLTVTGSTICKGGKNKLPVSMENEEVITAFQFDVEVPQGVMVTDVQLGERSSDSHTIEFNKQADGSYRVIAVSLQKTPFSGNEGELVSLMLSAEKNIESDDYNIGIKNIVLTTSSKEKIYPEDVSGVLTVLNFEQGDADGDGFVDVADVVAMIDYILDSSTSDIVFLAADMNADGEIDIFDVMIAINIVLKRENSAGSRTRASGNTEERAIVTATVDGIQLGVNDASRFTAFQFDVEVGDGMQLTDARLNGNAGNHELHYINNGPNSYRVIGVSMDNSTLTASGNDLVELSFSKGGCTQISNIVFVTPQKSKVNFASGNSEVTGIGRIRYEQAEEIFDLSGRKANSDRSRLPKGIYIINNKKVVIK